MFSHIRPQPFYQNLEGMERARPLRVICKRASGSHRRPPDHQQSLQMGFNRFRRHARRNRVPYPSTHTGRRNISTRSARRPEIREDFRRAQSFPFASKIRRVFDALRASGSHRRPRIKLDARSLCDGRLVNRLDGPGKHQIEFLVRLLCGKPLRQCARETGDQAVVQGQLFVRLALRISA